MEDMTRRWETHVRVSVVAHTPEEAAALINEDGVYDNSHIGYFHMDDVTPSQLRLAADQPDGDAMDEGWQCPECAHLQPKSQPVSP
jgi:hypothetical protein